MARKQVSNDFEMVKSDPGASRLIVDVEPEARGKEVHHHLVGLVRLEAKRLGAAEEWDATLMNWPNREPSVRSMMMRQKKKELSIVMANLGSKNHQKAIKNH